MRLEISDRHRAALLNSVLNHVQGDTEAATRNMVASLEATVSRLIGAIPCPGIHGASTWCTGCGARV